MLAHTVLTLRAEGRMPHRAFYAWMVRLADMSVQAGAWTAGLRFLARVPRSYLRDLPDDADRDPELAARALRLSLWLEQQFQLPSGLVPPVQVCLELARA